MPPLPELVGSECSTAHHPLDKLYFLQQVLDEAYGRCA